MSDLVADLKASAVFRPRGRIYEEFEVGEQRVHHWGRTITEADAIQFAHSTLAYNPLYFNKEYAKELGHPDIVVMINFCSSTPNCCRLFARSSWTLPNHPSLAVLLLSVN